MEVGGGVREKHEGRRESRGVQGCREHGGKHEERCELGGMGVAGRLGGAHEGRCESRGWGGRGAGKMGGRAKHEGRCESVCVWVGGGVDEMEIFNSNT